MLRGIYTGASGMLAQQARLDTISNNLANVDKTGYKKDLTLFKAFPDMIIRRINDNGLGEIPLGSYDSMPFVGKLGTGVEVNEVYTKFDQGAMQRTSNPLDLALEGQGFMAIATERGERYTRNGSFTINQDGVVVNHNGYPLLGENGIIRAERNSFMVTERGEIIDINTREVIDRIRLVDFEHKRELKKEGESMYRETEHSGPPLPPENLNIKQGFLEKSNVNIVREMVNMIEVQRSYEANQKTVTSHDQMLGKLINDVAR